MPYSPIVLTDEERIEIAALPDRVATSAGAADAGKYIILDPAGKIAASFFTWSTYQAVLAATIDQITNLAVETAFATDYGIAADQFIAADALDFEIGLAVVAVNVADTLQIQVRLGGLLGTEILDIPATLYAAGDYIRIKGSAIVAAIGAGGAIHRELEVKRKVLGIPSAAEDIENDLALDTTAACDLTVTATWSAANAGNQVDLRHMKVALVQA
jgi:hypothetical protein